MTNIHCFKRNETLTQLLFAAIITMLFLTIACDGKKETKQQNQTKPTPTATPTPKAAATPSIPQTSPEGQDEKNIVQLLGEMEKATNFIEWFDLRTKLLSKAPKDPRTTKAIETRQVALLAARKNKTEGYYNITDAVEILDIAFERQGEIKAQKARTVIQVVVKANGPLPKDYLFSVMGMVDAKNATLLNNQTDRLRSGALWTASPSLATTKWVKDTYYKITIIDPTFLQTTYNISIGMQENKNGNPGPLLGRRVFIGPKDAQE